MIIGLGAISFQSSEDDYRLMTTISIRRRGSSPRNCLLLFTKMEEMAGMDWLCSDKIGTLTLNKLLLVYTKLVEVLAKELDADMVILMAARASRLETKMLLMLQWLEH